MKAVMCAALVCMALQSASVAAASHGAAVVLRCGSVVDVEAQKRLGGTSLLVVDGVIEKIAPSLSVPADASEIDLTRATCLPGLMDMHIHLMLSTDRTPAALFYSRSSAAKVLLAMKNAQTLLRNGFTTIRIVGDLDYHFGLVDLRNAINAGDVVGPRMLVAPHILGVLGGHSDLNDVAPDLPYAMTGTVVSSGTDAVREAVRREVKYGADWIKITASGGAMSIGDDPRVQQFTDEEIRAFVDEAHRYGKRIAVHAHGNAAALIAARAGVDSIEHGTMLQDDSIKVMVERGVYLVPTIYVVDWLIEQGHKANVAKESLDKVAMVQRTRDEAFRKAYKAGVKLAYGTDPIFPYDQTNREFAALVRHGVSPMDALRSATINAATMLGLEKEIGSLAAGKRADIVAVPGNPLDDVTVMERVGFVMKGGRIIRDDMSPQ